MRILQFYSLLFFAAISSCKTSGIYQHTICKKGPNCFRIELNSDKTFQYKYWQDILGKGTISGIWVKQKDTIILIATPRIIEAKTSVVTNELQNDSENRLCVKLLRSRNDTIPLLSYYRKLQDSVLILTDSLGCFSLTGKGMTDLLIKDWLVVHGATWLANTDSIFKVNLTGHSEITINIAMKNQDAMFTYMPRKYLKKGRKLFALKFEPEYVILGKNSYYIKMKE